MNELDNISLLSYDEIRKLFYERFGFDASEKTLQVILNKTRGDYSLINDLFISAVEAVFRSDDIDIIYQPCIVDKYGVPIDKVDDTTKCIITEITDEFLYELSQNTNILYELSSYKFECVIAKIFEKQGFSVKITPKTRDGGKDIFIAKQGLASFLFYVECKRYAPNKLVGVDIIQRLYGVISAEKVNGGFIATTSHFSKSARNYVEEHNLVQQLTLQDYNTISDILKTLQYNTQ